jgi:AraC-like DNA-binding protein
VYLSKPFRTSELLTAISSRIDFPVVDAVPLNAGDRRFLEKLNASIAGALADPGFGPEELATRMGLSRRQLLRQVTRLTGESLRVVLRSARLREGERLIAAGEHATVSEIAARIGMSVRYFSCLYREKHGRAPGGDLRGP